MTHEERMALIYQPLPQISYIQPRLWAGTITTDTFAEVLRNLEEGTKFSFRNAAGFFESVEDGMFDYISTVEEMA